MSTATDRVRRGVLAAACALAWTCTPARAQSGIGQFFKDEGTNLRVVTKLQFHKQLLREQIEVKTNQGSVTLSGNVSSTDLIPLAGQLAAEVSGVNKVINLLKVGPPIPIEPRGGG